MVANVDELVREIRRWGESRPKLAGDLDADAGRMADWIGASAELSRRLQHGPLDPRARADWHTELRRAFLPFIRAHIRALAPATEVTGITTLLRTIGGAFPFLAPSREEHEADAARPLRHKLGVEYKAAILLSAVLEDAEAGKALCQAARRPTSTARELLPQFRETGRIKLLGASIARADKVAYVEIDAPETLNAEDDAVLDALEVCVDLALLDETIEVGVLRGAVVHKSRLAGRRVFCSGLNLSALYGGKLSYLYYVRRELGLVSKLYRGLAEDDVGRNADKPWIGVVDAHAIGGGCQLLLVMDYVIAERGAVLTLPAGREGIMPGAANLRMGRFVGELAARRAVLLEQHIAVDDELGRRMVDEVIAAEQIDASIGEVVKSFLAAGPTSVAANRKALRLGHEPLAMFQAYMAHFAIAQADCHFSDALVQFLESHWVARRGPAT